MTLSIGAIILGLINIGIVVLLLLIVLWFIQLILIKLLSITPDATIKQLCLAVVGLIALYMLVALFLGMPTVHIIGGT